MPLRIWLASFAIPAALVACGAKQTNEPGEFGGGDDGGAMGHGDSSISLPDALAFVDGDGTEDASGSPDASGAPDAAVEAAPPPPGSCIGKMDGTACVHAPNNCYADAVCTGGLCGGLVTRADGFNWAAGDDSARCCGGMPIHVNSDTNCGACGIRCNAANGESCSALAGHYFCRGCVASAACWSGCCSTSFAPNSCAASDCAGNCSAAHCPAGAHCVNGLPNSSDYCAY